MFAILYALGMFVADLFKSRSRLEAENLFLRHQLSIALRRAPPRLRLRGSDRALLIWMTRLWPSLLSVMQVVQPERILRWHRAGFKMVWRWKSRNMGRARIDRGLRDLIRRMSRENPLWGACVHLPFALAPTIEMTPCLFPASRGRKNVRVFGQFRLCLDNVEQHLRQNPTAPTNAFKPLNAYCDDYSDSS